jgi:hypothetical protein
VKVYFLTKERNVIVKDITTPTRWIAYNDSIYRIDNSAIGMSKEKGTLKPIAEIVFQEGNPYPLFTADVQTSQENEEIDIMDDVLFKNLIENSNPKSDFGFKNITGFFENIFNMKTLMIVIAIPVSLYVIYVLISSLLGGKPFIPT